MHAAVRLVLVLLAATEIAVAQTAAGFSHRDGLNYVAPQAWSSSRAAARDAARVEVVAVDVHVDIVEQVATTRLLVTLRNPGSRPEEAVLLIPVPAGAAIRGFDFHGASAEPTARLIGADEARATFREIVSKLKDPALLEFIDCSLISSSVFPVPANGEQRVSVTYETLCPRDGRRVEYVLPRTGLLGRGNAPWTIRVGVRSKAPLATAFSPSHPIEIERKTDRGWLVTLAGGATREPGSFMLDYLVADGDVSASLLAYPDPRGRGGYFLLLAGVPPRPADAPRVARELTVVIDTSGSMSGQKIDQAREAARQVVEGLRDADTFNLITYAHEVTRFAAAPVPKTAASTARAREFLQAIEARGGTNLGDGLLEALRQPATPGALPIVLLLSDGVPTVGLTGEVELREAAARANTAHRRVFCFGVGTDVNAPLLDALSVSSRGAMVTVLPSENVEVKVGSLFAKFEGPLLVAPRLVAFDGGDAAPRVTDVQPRQLGDLFDGDQLVVLGRYRGEAPLSFRLEGEYQGEPRKLAFELSLAGATGRNAFVGRLWANRRIADLVDAIRQLGAAPGASGATAATVTTQHKELIDEIVRLSTEFGILTEYTSFLALEGTDLTAADRNRDACGANLHRGAVMNRTGTYGTSQQGNLSGQRAQTWMNNGTNCWNDERMSRVAVDTVQQVGGRAMYRRGACWYDGDVLAHNAAPAKAAIDEVVTFGTPRFEQLFRALAQAGDTALAALGGEVVFRHEGRTIKVVFDQPGVAPVPK